MALSGTLLASDVEFGIVFGVFVLALLVLAVVAIRWGVRKDRPGRQAWRQRHLDARRNGSGSLGSRATDPHEDR
jgi:hypothetical protein